MHPIGNFILGILSILVISFVGIFKQDAQDGQDFLLIENANEYRSAARIRLGAVLRFDPSHTPLSGPDSNRF